MQEDVRDELPKVEVVNYQKWHKPKRASQRAAARNFVEGLKSKHDDARDDQHPDRAAPGRVSNIRCGGTVVSRH